jgi:hypothetical protein
VLDLRIPAFAANPYVANQFGNKSLRPFTNISAMKKFALILAILILFKVSSLRAQSTSGSDNYDGALAVDAAGIGGNFSAAASGYGSVALGFDAVASGVGSISLGYVNTASGNYSTAFGWATVASGYYSTSSGYVTTASADYSFVVGVDNIGGGTPGVRLPTDPIFEIGNGNDGDYVDGFGSDAFVVYRNGNAALSGTLSISGSNPVLVQPAGDISMGSFTGGPQPQ